jgi:hypothetical protein
MLEVSPTIFFQNNVHYLVWSLAPKIISCRFLGGGNISRIVGFLGTYHPTNYSFCQLCIIMCFLETTDMKMFVAVDSQAFKKQFMGKRNMSTLSVLPGFCHNTDSAVTEDCPLCRR